MHNRLMFPLAPEKIPKPRINNGGFQSVLDPATEISRY